MSCNGWRERIGRDIIGANGYPYPPIKDKHYARIEQEPGTRYETKQGDSGGTRCTARFGTMDCSMTNTMSTVRYCFLRRYFVNASYDRPKFNPLCMAVSLIAPHYPYQCPLDLFNYYMQRVEPIVEEPNEQFGYDDFFQGSGLAKM